MAASSSRERWVNNAFNLSSRMESSIQDNPSMNSNLTSRLIPYDLSVFSHAHIVCSKKSRKQRVR